MRVVNQYIGVKGGLLGDFTYRTHAEFYPEYCELSVDPGQWEGTTRQRFIQILASVEPREQARILRGVLARFPPDAANQPETRRGLKVELDRMIGRLEQGPVPSAGGAHLVESVRDALTDAEILLREKGPANAVDRVHTALHGYLKHACGRAGATVRPDASIGALLRLLRQHDTSLAAHGGPRRDEMNAILNSIGSIFDALNPIRNKASMAHPNPQLGRDEAQLVVNLGRTLINYLSAKLDPSDPR